MIKLFIYSSTLFNIIKNNNNNDYRKPEKIYKMINSEIYLNELVDGNYIYL